MRKEMPPEISMNGKRLPLLAQFPVNAHFIIGIYQGTLSKYDMIIRYRQLINGEWTRVRTPKHIHWAVDILIKQHEKPEETRKFIDFLLEHWNTIQPITNDSERNELLDIQNLKQEVEKEAQIYKNLANEGEYSVKFLLLLAKLLMFQEKTNYPDAYMFKCLLEQLRDSPDIFSVISTATHR
ncbi:MAG: hypothetical protein SPE30_10565 [Candidatus Treponema excrementipullorum]|nr:hypothetical protein [Candidatus Treponema excrementipullorum]